MISLVTVTGADDSVVSLKSLQSLAEEFPYAEFGILFDLAYSGRPRYPSSHWLKQLKNTRGLTLSGHLCGSLVLDFLNGEWIFDMFIDTELAAKFSRWQLNTHGIPYDCNVEGLGENISRLASMGQSVIFQQDGANADTLNLFLAREGEPRWSNAHVLYDLSHGCGLLPNDWPKPEYANFSGFAGGLSPENLHEQAQLILEQTGRRPIWVDAETCIRSDGDKTFNTGLVRAFLEEAGAFVAQ